MFTGIVQRLCPINQIEDQPNLRRLTVNLGELCQMLDVGASVAINGVCLTVTSVQPPYVGFDVIQETLSLTNLKTRVVGSLVNVERSYRAGDEIGGHILSGHITGQVQLVQIIQAENLKDLWFQVEPNQMKYLHHKGFTALDGASLTIAEVDWGQARIRVSLIPETLRRTTLGNVQRNDWVNLEVDTQSQSVVETVERLLENPEWLNRFRALLN